ncbi:MAG: hypothetical protein LV471_10850 [Nitrosomonas sp.]|nr:hypothetical protein [Nitrosomonas sp.]
MKKLTDFLQKEFKKASFLQDIEEASNLAQYGFYSSAFLRHWQTVEAISRSLMIFNSACKEAEETGNKIFKVSEKRQLIFPKITLIHKFTIFWFPL